MQSKEKDNFIFIRLFPNESIIDELEKACKKHDVKTAIVISGIGQLKNFKLGYFKKKNDYIPEGFKKPYELLSLSGNITKEGTDYNIHMHAVLGNENKNTVGGHLLKGLVEVTNEIVLIKTDFDIKRKIEEKTGLKGMFLD